MDIRSMIQFSFSSILMVVLWSQSEVNAMIMPDCQSLGKDFAKLKTSGESRRLKFDRKWRGFFSSAQFHITSEALRLDRKCPVEFHYSVYPRDVKIRSFQYKEFVNKVEATGKMTEEAISTYQTYTDMTSSSFEDRIMFAKFVEDICEVEVFKLYELLMSYEKTVCSACTVKRVPDHYVYFNWPLSNVSYNNIDQMDEDTILQKVVTANQQLYDRVDRGLFNSQRRVEIEQELKDKKLKEQNSQVFFRGVQRMKRLEEKLKKGFVPLNIEAVFHKREAIYEVDRIKRILIEAVNKYSEHFKCDDIKAYQDRLRILAYQMNLLK